MFYFLMESTWQPYNQHFQSFIIIIPLSLISLYFLLPRKSLELRRGKFHYLINKLNDYSKSHQRFQPGNGTAHRVSVKGGRRQAPLWRPSSILNSAADIGALRKELSGGQHKPGLLATHRRRLGAQGNHLCAHTRTDKRTTTKASHASLPLPEILTSYGVLAVPSQSAGWQLTSK